MWNVCKPIFVGMASRFWRFCSFLFKTAKFFLQTMDPIYNPWGSKIRIGSKNLCKKRLMWNACKPILVGVASPVSEILLLFCLPSKRPNLPFRPWSSKNLIDWNWLKKIHASRRWCNMHVHQYWWAWPLRFRRYCYSQKWPNFPFRPWTVVHGRQQI